METTAKKEETEDLTFEEIAKRNEERKKKQAEERLEANKAVLRRYRIKQK